VICDPCRGALSGLRPDARAAWRYEPLEDAIVWADERAALCAECERAYRVVLNVRTQHLMGEAPSPEFLATYEHFRQAVPGWAGFRRTKLTAAQRKAARPAAMRARKQELLDED